MLRYGAPKLWFEPMAQALSDVRRACSSISWTMGSGAWLLVHHAQLRRACRQDKGPSNWRSLAAPCEWLVSPKVPSIRSGDPRLSARRGRWVWRSSSALRAIEGSVRRSARKSWTQELQHKKQLVAELGVQYGKIARDSFASEAVRYVGVPIGYKVQPRW